MGPCATTSSRSGFLAASCAEDNIVVSVRARSPTPHLPPLRAFARGLPSRPEPFVLDNESDTWRRVSWSERGHLTFATLEVIILAGSDCRVAVASETQPDEREFELFV